MSRAQGNTRSLVWLTVVAMTCATVACSSGSSTPEPTAAAPHATSTPTPAAEPDHRFQSVDVDLSLLSPAAMGLGSARVTDNDGYAVDFSWSGSIGEVAADPTTNKPGETTVSIEVRFSAVLHNVTAGRQTPLDGLSTFRLAPVWAVDSPLCQALAAMGHPSPSSTCGIRAVGFPVSGPLAVDSWSADWTAEAMTIVVPEDTADAVLQSAASPAAWILTGPDPFASWVLDNGLQAADPMDSTWWVSAPTPGISAPLVGSVDPATTDLDTGQAGVAVAAILGAGPDSAPLDCPLVPSGTQTIASVARIWGFDSSAGVSTAQVQLDESPNHPPQFDCQTPEGTAGGLWVIAGAGDPALVDPQQLANGTATTNDPGGPTISQQIPVYGGALVMVQYQTGATWVYWSDDQVFVSAYVGQVEGSTTQQQFVRAGQWAVAALPTMLASLATYAP